MPCHNKDKNCAVCQIPSPCCVECQADVERGLWYKREGEALIGQYKQARHAESQECARQKAISAALAQSMTDAIKAATFEIAKEILHAGFRVMVTERSEVKVVAAQETVQ